MYDIVVKNGTVVDPSQGIHERKNIAVSKGRIVDLRDGINAAEAKRVVDASDMIVTPGFVDIHVHCCYGLAHLAIDPELVCLAKGSTTVLDAGSMGELNYMGFKRYVIQNSRTRIFSLLNIESQGMIEFSAEKQKWPQLINGNDELFINIDNTLETIEKNRDNILGIKWAHHTVQGLSLARKAADKANCPLMAENHHQPENLKYMKKGDIVTHLYHGIRMAQHDGLLDADRKVQPEFFRAIKEGVIMDVGHGAGSFVWLVAEEGFRQGIRPDTISTDIHSKSYPGPAGDMPTTMSKFLHLGMDLDEVIKASTLKPAEVIGKQDELGTLKIDAYGDIAIFQIEEGKFNFFDVTGEGRVGNQRLSVTRVIKSGEIVF